MAVAAELTRLQDLIKRDNESYRDEFILQYKHFTSELELFRLNPRTKSKEFAEYANFISQVSAFYLEESKDFPALLIQLLDESAEQILPDIRISLVKAVVLLRSRNFVSLPSIVPLFFKFFHIHDRELRKLVYNQVVNDIKRSNRPRRNPKLNKTLQNFMEEMLQESATITAKKALDMCIELHRKRVWDDARTVNIIANGCFSKDTKTLVAALQFFLSTKPIDEDDTLDGEEPEEDTSSKDYMKKQSKLYKTLSSGHAKKTKKRQKVMERVLATINREKKRDDKLRPNFPAIDLLNDPQAFAEKVFGCLKRSTERFEIRIMMMNLISRMIVTHQLQLDNFYPWMQRYLQPHQKEVTHIMAIIAQACHELINPEAVAPVVRTIADNFISDRCSNEMMTIGLSTIREICIRSPFVIEDTLLQDLTQYKTWKDKGVAMAARSLISTFRQIDPTLLNKRDRGRDASVQKVIPLKYGETRVANAITGIELLEEEYSERDTDFSSFTSGASSEFDDEFEDEDGEMIDDEEGDDDDDDDDDNEEGAEDDDDDDEEVDEEFDGGEEADEDEEDETQKKAEKKEKVIDFFSADNHPKPETDFYKAPAPVAPAPSPRLDRLRILTDEDFERLDELRVKQIADRFTGRKRSRAEIDVSEHQSAVELDESVLTDYVKRAKVTREEKLAAAEAGREGRDFGSKKKGRVVSSTSNKEKAKNQPFMLAKQSRKVQLKHKRSSYDKMVVHRKHSRNTKSYDKRKKK
mmetsp:Transcript_31022/g.52245  ORF Transcript_31022/g.52245 Transcript_31022/m.52245 type:complete len:750 (+) Transcript_31022:164-2413(+)